MLISTSISNCFPKKANALFFLGLSLGLMLLVTCTEEENSIVGGAALADVDPLVDDLALPVLTVGGSVEDILETPRDQDDFRIILETGVSYQFDLEGKATSKGSLSDPRLSLFSRNRERLLRDSHSGVGLNSRLLFTPSSGGDYYLVASSQYNMGSYTLIARKIFFGDSESGEKQGRDIFTGIRGRLDSPGDVDWFQVSIKAGKICDLTLEGVESGLGTLSDPSLVLHYPNGGWITHENGGIFSTGSQTARIRYSADKDELLYLAAESYEGGHVGSYFLKAAYVEEDDHPDNLGTDLPFKTISNGGRAEGRIQYLKDRDLFQTELVSGVHYGFLLTLEDIDHLYFTIKNSEQKTIYGDYIVSDRASGIGNYIMYLPKKSGTYYASVEISMGIGVPPITYELSLESISLLDDYAGDASTTGVLSLGGPASEGSIESVGDRDWFAIRLELGRNYVFEMISQGQRPLRYSQLNLYDGDGKAVISDNRLIHYRARETGIHYLEMRGEKREYLFNTGNKMTGSYGLRGREAGDAYPTLSIGSPWEHDFPNLFGNHFFLVSLEEGVEYRFTVESTIGNGEFSPGLDLIDIDNSTVMASDSKFKGPLTLNYRPAKSDTYLLSFHAYRSQAVFLLDNPLGPYRLRVDRME